MVVEPVYPFEGCVFNGFEVALWSATMDDIGLEEAADRLGESIVVDAANASNLGFDACIGQPFGVFDREILGRFKVSGCWTARSR